MCIIGPIICGAINMFNFHSSCNLILNRILNLSCRSPRHHILRTARNGCHLWGGFPEVGIERGPRRSRGQGRDRQVDPSVLHMAQRDGRQRQWRRLVFLRWNEAPQFKVCRDACGVGAEQFSNAFHAVATTTTKKLLKLLYSKRTQMSANVDWSFEALNGDMLFFNDLGWSNSRKRRFVPNFFYRWYDCERVQLLLLLPSMDDTAADGQTTRWRPWPSSWCSCVSRFSTFSRLICALFCFPLV